MNEQQGEDLKRTLREVGVEIGKLLDHARGMAKEAMGDAKGLAGRVVGGDQGSPLDQIERLGELREKGFVTDAEFQEKKSELLKKIG
jgi:hypothetical protein